MKPIQVGLLGIGTVGSGTFNVLRRNQEEIQRRAGRGIEITMVADLDVARAQSIVGPDVKVVNDARAVIANPEIDIVIELIGGYGIAKALVLEAIAAGKHVVTANKALLAVHGTEIFAAAAAKGVMVAFEAAVAGGIPIIKALREGLTANRIEWVAGIINGTSNFIVSAMRERGLGFAAALAEAQALGYAEADPAFDVQGTDAAHKLSILSAIAFGSRVDFPAVETSGITRLRAADIAEADTLGYVIRLIGMAETDTNGDGVERLFQRVQRILRLGHVKQVRHQLQLGVFLELGGQHTIELFALCGAVLAVAVDVEGAVVGHDAHVAGAAAELQVMAAQAIAAEGGGHVELRLFTGFTRPGLDHTACGVAIQLCQRPSEHLDALCRGQADGRGLTLTVRGGGRNAVGDEADATQTEGRTGTKPPNGNL